MTPTQRERMARRAHIEGERFWAVYYGREALDIDDVSDDGDGYE